VWWLLPIIVSASLSVVAGVSIPPPSSVCPPWAVMMPGAATLCMLWDAPDLSLPMHRHDGESPSAWGNQREALSAGCQTSRPIRPSCPHICFEFGNGLPDCSPCRLRRASDRECAHRFNIKAKHRNLKQLLCYQVRNWTPCDKRCHGVTGYRWFEQMIGPVSGIFSAPHRDPTQQWHNDLQ